MLFVKLPENADSVMKLAIHFEETIEDSQALGADSALVLIMRLFKI